MTFRLLTTLLVLSIATSLRAGDFYGFKTINLLNLKDNTKCSGVVMNTEQGCFAATSAHCVRGLGIGEENIIIEAVSTPELSTNEGKDIYSKIVLSNQEAHRTHLV